MIPLSRLRDLMDIAKKDETGSMRIIRDLILEVERLRELVVKMDNLALRVGSGYPGYDIEEILNDEMRKEVGR